MPEGHTVHRLARNLARTLGDAPVRASSPQGRFAEGAARIDGGVILDSEAYGKYLFVTFSGGEVLHVHLGLIGRFRNTGTPAQPARESIRLRLAGDGATWDLTGPTRCEVITPDEQAAIAAGIGPDPLRPDGRPSVVAERMRRTSKPVGAVLLDQRVIAGLGNIYRAEVLFLCGIHPQRPAKELSDDEVDALWRESARLLRIGLRTGRIITTDPAEIGRPRSRMRRDDTLYVYHREHCRHCGDALRTVQLGGRPLQYCPTCQPH